MVLDSVAASESATLPTGAIQPFGVTWRYSIEQEDRAAALGCYRAATMLALKRALRNGSVSVSHSIAYRQREERMIPHDLWERDRARLRARSRSAPIANRSSGIWRPRSPQALRPWRRTAP